MRATGAHLGRVSASLLVLHALVSNAAATPDAATALAARLRQDTANASALLAVPAAKEPHSASPDQPQFRRTITGSFRQVGPFRPFFSRREQRERGLR